VSAYSNAAQITLTRESAALEQRLEPVTAELNAFPLRVNRATWQAKFDEAEKTADDLIEYCRFLAKWEGFRPNSPADCRRALYDDRGITAKGTSKKTQAPLTDKDTLAEMANSGDALAEAISDARSAISGLGQLRKWGRIAEFGLVQPLWNSTGTPHGRYTSESPCLNNRIRAIRATIEPAAGFSFLSMDLSQAEYVTWASLSGDLTLSELFLSGQDFHTVQAQIVLELVPAWDLRGQELRQAGKTLNFSILYLMQPYTLAIKLGCSLQIARKIIKTYYRRAKTGIKYIHRVLDNARDVGFVETRFGRRRYCFDYQAGLGEREKHEVEKTLWSHHNAGTAAELVKQKQCEIWSALRGEGFNVSQVRLSLNMYDQLIWSVRDDVIDVVKPTITEIWNQRVPGFLPFRSQIKTSKTWGGL
jgi:DNA polymerase I